MSSLNKVMIIGRLGSDPETRNTQSGQAIVNMRVAVSESWKDKNTGERKEKTEWITVVIFNEGLGKVASSYLKKGSKVYLEGQLQTRKWTDKEGVERYSTEVVLQQYRGELVLLDGKPSGDDDAQAPRKEIVGFTKPAPRNSSYDLDDEVPF